MNIRMNAGTVVVLVALTLLVAGCAQSPIGLFESIELEREIVDDRNLDNEILVGAMTLAASDYYVASATLRRRDSVDPDYQNGDVAQWVAIAAPGASNYTTASLTTFDGSGAELVYIVYSSQTATDAGLYAIDPAADPVAVLDTDRVFGTEVSGIDGLGRTFVANDGIATYLLVAVRETGTSRYSVFMSQTGAVDSFTEVVGTEANLPVQDIAVGSTGLVAFVTDKSVLVDSDGLNAGLDPVDVTANLGIGTRQPEFGGIYYQESSTTLWVTDNEGYLYRSVDSGATWTLNATPHQVSTSNDDALQFTDIVSLDNAGTELLVVGTIGQGYRELNADLIPQTPSATTSNYQASEFAQATVICFFLVPNRTIYVPTSTGSDYELQTGDLLFAGTSNLGLWKTLYGGTAPQWVRE